MHIFKNIYFALTITSRYCGHHNLFIILYYILIFDYTLNIISTQHTPLQCRLYNIIELACGKTLCLRYPRSEFINIYSSKV